MDILITGGAGFIGSALAKRMISGGHSVTVLDNLTPQVHGKNARFPKELRQNARCVQADVCDIEQLRLAIHDKQVIVHLAAETGTAQSMYEVQHYARTNVQGTASLLDVLVNTRPRDLQKILVASSRALYGEGKYECGTHGIVYPHARSREALSAGRFEVTCPACGADVRVLPTSEDTPSRPSSFYGLTKQVQEQMVLMFGEALRIDAFALRYQNVYGPGQSLQNSYTGLLAVFSNLVRQGKSVNVFEDGLESRDFVYIDDVVDATAACLSQDVHGIQSLNVGTGIRTTVLDVANAVKKHFNAETPVRVTGEFRIGDIRHNAADIARITELTGFKPKRDFYAGLRAFLDWAVESETPDPGYERSIAELRDRGLLGGAG